MALARGDTTLGSVQRIDDRFVYSASDLNDDAECRRLTELERAVAAGGLRRPARDATSELLAGKGEEHERRHLERLREQYRDNVVELPARIADNTLAGMREAATTTIAAMRRGAALIYQATFFDESDPAATFYGRADFLRRVEEPSRTAAWSYEVLETKLALAPKAYFLMQLCNYSEHVARIMGTAPRYGSVILGSGEIERLRIADYDAYYRRRKRAFLARMAALRGGDGAPSYPQECAHCAMCTWSDVCENQRQADEYLGLVAWMRRDHIARFESGGITTIAQLAHASDTHRPPGVAFESFAKLRAQAVLQHRQRTHRRDCDAHDGECFELLAREAPGEAVPRTGFDLLFEPDPGDVYFDMEGDPLYAPGRALEYLFGVYYAAEDRYQAFWARSDADEQRAFEALIDALVARRAAYPNMHVYHYAPYETSALKRLMGRYGTRERELDELLRAEVFVDLYAVVRGALRVGEESYSIKYLEPYYGMRRTADVKKGDDSIVQFETWLVTRDDAILDDIETYNEEDCRSTHLLHRWLIERRGEAELRDGPFGWRVPKPAGSTPPDDGASDVARRLVEGVRVTSLEDLRASGSDVRARWLLGNLLEYDRREAKPAWWKLFDRKQNVDMLTEFDHEALGDLRLCDDVAPFQLRKGERNLTYTYEFPDQQHQIGPGKAWCAVRGKHVGEVIKVDDTANRVLVKTNAAVGTTLRALVPGGPVENLEQRKALQRLAAVYLDGTLARRYPATLDLLTAAAPRVGGRPPGAPIQPADPSGTAMAQVVLALENSALVVQGPPGTGKSTKGAAMIVSLLAAGKRVAIMAGTHPAIDGFLRKIDEEATARGVSFRGVSKGKDDDTAPRGERYRNIAVVDGYEPFAQPHELAAGTPWVFPREAFDAAYDVLVIDEAGQMSLANALASSMAARSVVLLGDPLQLAQVSQGSHPVGTDLSILEHMLGDDLTVAPDRGIFLDESYRMHPAICRFVSESVYESRLRPAPGLDVNEVNSPGLRGSGLRTIFVPHAGNSRASLEEADRITAEVETLLRGTVTLKGQATRRIEARDILVVSPYNAQRRLIAARLEAAGLSAVRVGTVDKFQGQQAPIVFYSMATSSGDDIPRTKEFLFEKNRLNVAISRAQCLTVLVCSERLLDVSCSTPEQMALVNLLCRYAEES